jgi:hypothetical protein
MRLLRYAAGCHRRYQAAWRRLKPLRLSEAATPAPARQASPASARIPAATPALAHTTAASESFRLIQEPEPADPFDELLEDDDPELEGLLARIGALRALDYVPEATSLAPTGPAQSQRPAPAAPAPANPSANPVSPPASPPMGNRRSRRAKLRRERAACK